MFKNQKDNSTQNKVRVNEQIRCPNVMLVDVDKNVGVLRPEEALRRARDLGLDLVEVSNNGKIPIVKIMDYGKFKYEQAVKEKEKKKHQKQSQEKEIWLSPSIGDHDLSIKAVAAKKFLNEGHRVFVKLQYKKRANAHKELGFEVIQKFIAEVSEAGVLQSQPRLDGSFLNCTFDPKSK